jgi:hypothetical protein
MDRGTPGPPLLSRIQPLNNDLLTCAFHLKRYRKLVQHRRHSVFSPPNVGRLNQSSTEVKGALTVGKSDPEIILYPHG